MKLIIEKARLKSEEENLLHSVSIKQLNRTCILCGLKIVKDKKLKRGKYFLKNEEK